MYTYNSNTKLHSLQTPQNSLSYVPLSTDALHMTKTNKESCNFTRNNYCKRQGFIKTIKQNTETTVMILIKKWIYVIH